MGTTTGWSAIYAQIQALDPEPLVRHVLDLARQVNSGAAAGDVVDELVIAMRELTARVRLRGGKGSLPAEHLDPRLYGNYDEMLPPGAQTARMDMVAFLLGAGVPALHFASATAGEIRAIFTSANFDGLGLRKRGLWTLPRQLPTGDAARVVLYEAGRPRTDGLLNAVARGVTPSTEDLLEQLLDRARRSTPHT